ncbi:MAG: 3-isopropylmalate dehydratase small subunit [bacterium]|nr:3-isopropylmalate dehydratase small subunit [bacterium]MDE0601584.1 3-isopropylmalate dehydratase small subunit [bacterium]
MRPVSVISGSMLPLPRANVDTDQIMPKQFLKRVERTGYGEFLFWDWRRTPGGELDPGFALNQPRYQEAKVLVAGPNFGSGSSREHAPWGLQDWGFEAVIAPSLADIFRTNCTKIGLLPLQLSAAEVSTLTRLATERPESRIAIDLESQTVEAPGLSTTFEIEPFTKWRMLNGYDDIGLTLRHLGEIDAFELTRSRVLPTLK